MPKEKEKERIGGVRSSKQHLSAEEKKKSFIMYILVGFLAAILLIIIIIMIPKGKKKEEVTDTTTTTKSVVQENVVTNEVEDEKVKRNKNKVSMAISPESLTEDGGVIVITDTNANPYKWTPIYKLQEKIDGEWKDVELKNPENNILPSTEIENPTGVLTQSVIWSNKYGKLEKGKDYRIVKETEGIEFYAEFQLK